MKITVFYGLPWGCDGGGDIVIDTILEGQGIERFYNDSYQGAGTFIKTIQVPSPYPVTFKPLFDDDETHEKVKAFHNLLKQNGLGEYIHDCNYYWFIK